MDDFRVIFRPGNYEASVAFYRESLGFALVDDWNEPDDRGTIVQAGGGWIELLEEPTLSPPGSFRVQIRVDDPDALATELRARGVAVDARDRPWGYREVVVRDPDGIEVIFYTVTDKEKAGHP